MTNTPKDGGPAFPINSPSGSPEYMPMRDGMSLRDWFAGQALPSVIDIAGSSSGITEIEVAAKKNGVSIDFAMKVWSAATAYDFADAMLEVRNQKR